MVLFSIANNKQDNLTDFSPQQEICFGAKVCAAESKSHLLYTVRKTASYQTGHPMPTQDILGAKSHI
jgi:hypothetical protein